MSDRPSKIVALPIPKGWRCRKSVVLAFAPDLRHALLAAEWSLPGVLATPWLLHMLDLERGEASWQAGGEKTGCEWLAAAFTRDGRLVTSDMVGAALRDAGSGQAVTRFASPVAALALDRDGRVLSNLRGSDGTVVLRDVDTWEVRRRMAGHKGAVECVGFAPDGWRGVSGGQDGTLHMWDLYSGAELWRADAHPRGVTAVAVASDGVLLASGGRDRVLRLWDVSSGRELRALVGHTDAVRCVVFTPDGGRVLSAGNDTTVRCWDAATGVGRTFTGHTQFVSALAVSPDGRFALSGSYDRSVRRWELC